MRLLSSVVPLIFVVVSALAQPADRAQTLTIGFYGDPDSSTAQGAKLALSQIRQEGAFTGADGGEYQFELLFSRDPAALSESYAVLVLPDESNAPIGELVAWEMPALLLSSDAPLALRGIQATLFRGMTDRARLNDALIDFLVNRSTVRRVQVIGESAQFTDYAGRLALAGGVEIQQIADPLLTADDLNAILSFDPQAILYSGDGISAQALLGTLAGKNWTGYFLSDHLTDLLNLPDYQTPPGIELLDSAQWSAAAEDDLSRAFTSAYQVEFDEAPNAGAAAAYDLTWALRLMVTRIGGQASDLLANLPTTEVIRTTSGQIDPARYGGIDLYQAVAISAVDDRDTSRLLARYEAGTITELSGQVVTFATPTLLPSPTPSQVVITIDTGVLSVYAGTSSDYQSLGQLQRGDQVIILGQLASERWYLVQSPFGPGWIPAGYGTVFNPGIELPILEPPPDITATPSATLPPAPTAQVVTATPGGEEVTPEAVGTVSIQPKP